MTGDFPEDLSNRNYGPVGPIMPPPPIFKIQSNETLEAPVLQDILERLRRLEEIVAKLLVKENNAQLPPS